MNIPVSPFQDDPSFSTRKIDTLLCEERWHTEESQRFERFSKFHMKQNHETKLKELIRNGIPFRKRRSMWFHKSGGFNLMRQIGDNWDILQRTQQHAQYNNNFGSLEMSFENISPEFSTQFKSFLTTLSASNFMISYSPLIPYCSAMLLLVMEPNLAYFTIQSMINQSQKGSKYFTLTSNSFSAFLLSISSLLKSRNSKIYRHAVKLQINLPNLIQFIMKNFFFPLSNLPSATTFFDIF